jgi:hypothetical protein
MTRRHKRMVALYTAVGFIALGPSFWLMGRYIAIDRGASMQQVDETCGWAPRRIGYHGCATGYTPHGYHEWEDWLGLVKVEVGWRYRKESLSNDMVAREIAGSKRLTVLGFEIAADAPNCMW